MIPGESVSVGNAQEDPVVVLRIKKTVFGEEARRKMDKGRRADERGVFLQRVCAILNSGGGILFAEIANDGYNCDRDALGDDLEKGLNELLNPEPIQDFVQITQHAEELQFVVKSWRRAGLCTLSSGLFKRSGTCALPIPPADVVDYFLKRRKQDAGGGRVYKKACEFYNDREAHLGQSLDFGESAHVELKSFATENKLIQRLKETLPKYLSAFANTSGGFLLIGIDDKTKEVVGCGQGMTRSQLEEQTREICDEAQTRAVHLDQCPKPQSSWSPEVKVFPVTAAEEDLKFIIAIKIPPFCCAVFEKDPESWEIKGNEVSQLRHGDWLKRMQQSLPA